MRNVYILTLHIFADFTCILYYYSDFYSFYGIFRSINLQLEKLNKYASIGVLPALAMCDN